MKGLSLTNIILDFSYWVWVLNLIIRFCNGLVVYNVHSNEWLKFSPTKMKIENWVWPTQNLAEKKG